MNTNIMFLMGSSHYKETQKEYPFYMTEINGISILEKQILNADKLQNNSKIFCISESDVKSFHIDSVILQLDRAAKVIPIHMTTKGAICTAMLGVEYIDNEKPLLLMAIDDFIDLDYSKIISEFEKNNADAGVVSFTSIHPRYSFVKLDKDGFPIEFAEKNPISKNALASFYYFKHGSDFIDAAKNVIRKDSPVSGNFYISQTLNEMILKQKNIIVKKIENTIFHSLKNEAQLAEYICDYREQKGSK